VPYFGEHGADGLRQLLNRKDLAGARQRAALGRSFGVTENEILALAHLARHGVLTPSALGRLLALSSGGATTLVQRLERAA
jgi:DNA-binding MarR family transcriptional regulator